MKMSDYENEFQDEDFISHYVNINTAVEKILFTNKLRFSCLQNTNDPFENNNLALILVGMISREISQEKTDEFRHEVRNVSQKIANSIQNLKLACFCRNDLTLSSQPELYGFARPRMWAQYGDSHRGCCLILSKHNLLQELQKIKIKFHNSNVTYFDSTHLHKIYPNASYDLYMQNPKEYASILKNLFIKNYIFMKHKDFENENEYRIVLESPNEYEYVDISTIIKGIVYSDKISEFHRKLLLEYCERKNIPLIKIEWYLRSISFSLDNQNQLMQSF